MIGDVVEFIEQEKLLKPSVYSSEIQERLVLNNVVHPLDVPSKAVITKMHQVRLANVTQKTKCYSAGINNGG